MQQPGAERRNNLELKGVRGVFLLKYVILDLMPNGSGTML